MIFYGTGTDGYLMCILKNGFEIIDRPSTDISAVMDFGSKSEFGKGDMLSLYSSLANTLSLIELCNLRQIPLIYASSMAVKEETGMYAQFKLEAERNIKDYCELYLILRINRVYSKERKTGLIQKLRDNKVPESDFNNQVSYCTAEDFLAQTYEAVSAYMLNDQTGMTYEYIPNKTETLAEIKRQYV